jgi:hypothetical protein
MDQKRTLDKFFENYLLDLVNKTSTREIVAKKDYRKLFHKNTKIVFDKKNKMKLYYLNIY